MPANNLAWAWPLPAALGGADDEGVLFASQAMLRAFVEDRRARHFSLLSYIAARCRLTAILPPRAPKNENKIRFRHNIDALTNTIAQRMERMGINVYDPNSDFVGPDQLMLWDWVNDDGFHGTPKYGEIVMQRLIARGALDPTNEQEEKRL